MAKGDREILKADPEDGTTPIAHLLLEAIAIARISGRKKGILLLICRKTYGWVKYEQRQKETALSLDDCAKAFGIDRCTAQKLLTELTNDRILLRRFSKPGYGYTYGMNTRVNEWNNSCINLQLLTKLSTDGLTKNTTVELTKTSTPRVAKLAKPKQMLNKELNKENMNIDGRAKEIWGKTLTELRNQVNKANFDTWLRDAIGLRYAGSVFVIGVPQPYVADHIQHNQKSLIENTLGALLKEPVSVEFEILEREREAKTN